MGWYPWCQPDCLCQGEDCHFAYDQLGAGDAGWDVVIGTWTSGGCYFLNMDDVEVPYGCVQTCDFHAIRLLSDTHTSDNLAVSVRVDETYSDVCDLVTNDRRTEFKLVFSYAPSGHWFLQYVPTGVVFQFPGLYMPASEVRLCVSSGGTTTTILRIGITEMPEPEPRPIVPYRIKATHYNGVIVVEISHMLNAYVEWIGNGIPYGQTSSNSLQGIETFTICAGENFALNGTGRVGLGTGNEVLREAWFGEFGVACDVPVSCTAPPVQDPDEEPPGDPTGCCADLDALRVGDVIEAELSGIAYWLGPGCDDPTCATSEFLAALNATHTLECVWRDPSTIVFKGNLGFMNPCDDYCGGVEGFGQDLQLWVIIRKVSATECQAFGTFKSNCSPNCDIHFESFGWTAPTSCGLLALNAVGDNTGAYHCCLQAGSGAIALVIP